MADSVPCMTEPLLVIPPLLNLGVCAELLRDLCSLGGIRDVMLLAQGFDASNNLYRRYLRPAVILTLPLVNLVRFHHNVSRTIGLKNVFEFVEDKVSIQPRRYVTSFI